ncbi:hypothetical protein [Zoogloea sp.]|uniref:hypothetical protein n=1 Tax=Zoogloea sp. TaxID=49181 RepID=UPI0026321BDD|nr:hypothetical protein [Zoogloea sp.]MDD3354134.1 hypothetical protein [Zoogloea sp.]
MSRLFTKLPGFTRTPPGLERNVLRALPRLFWLGSLLLCAPSLLVRLWLVLQPDLAPGTQVTTTDIYVISLVILHWTVLFTVAIAAFICMVMKGPAYVADAYPLKEDKDDAWQPDR